MSLGTLVARAQPNTSSMSINEVYKMMLERAANIPGLGQEIKGEINNLLKSSSQGDFVVKARDVLSKVSKSVEKMQGAGEGVEKAKLSRAVEVLKQLAEEVGVPGLNRSLSRVGKLIKEGKIKEAKKTLREMFRDIEGRGIAKNSDLIGMAAAASLENIPSNATASEAITRAVGNINETMKILMGVIGRLKSTNASEQAIASIYTAIETLNRTKSMLTSVAEAVKITGEEKAKEIANETAKTRISDEINDTKEEIKELSMEIASIEREQNISLTEAWDILSNASKCLNMSLNALNNGEIGKAMIYLMKAKVLVKSVKKSIEEHVEKKEKWLKMRVIYEYKALVKRYNKLYSRFNKLYNICVKYNLTEALDMLNDADNILANASSLLNNIKDMINSGNYTKALNLIKEVRLKLEKVSSILCSVEDIVEAMKGAEGELYDEIKDLTKEINSIKEEADENLKNLNATLYNATIETIAKFNESLNNASSYLKSGDIKSASKIIKTVKRELEEFKNVIKEVPGLYEDVVELKSIVNELKKKYSNIPFISSILDKVEKLLDKITDELEQAIKNCSTEFIKNAEEMREEIHSLIEKIKEFLKSGVKVAFTAVDTNGLPVMKATIILDGEEYHFGEIKNVKPGIHNLSVGYIPEGFKFVKWKVIGNATIDNKMSPETNITIYGYTAIIMILNKTGSEKNLATVTFQIVDKSGKAVQNATIIFNGTEYANGDNITIPNGEYELKVGKIPENYEFVGWMVEGMAKIINPHNDNTMVIIKGDAVITMVVRLAETETVNLNFSVDKIVNLLHTLDIG